MAPRRTQAGPSTKTIKRLFALSGNRCAYPGCNDVLIEGDVVVGHVCHIKAASPDGPRYHAQQTSAQRHGYDNLILMCQKHHTLIDTDEKAYTVERLTQMKADHAGRCQSPDNAFGERAAGLIQIKSVMSVNQSGGISANTVNITVNPAAARTVAGPRLSVLDLLKIATREASSPPDREWRSAFGHRLRQAGADGTVGVWGNDLQTGWDMKSAPNIYVLDRISPEYFKDHWIDVQQGWLNQENAYIRTSRPAVAEPRFYSNLHVNRAEALEWIGRSDHSATLISARPTARPPNSAAKRLFQFQPTRNGPCLCGSGLKFKRCCADRLRVERDYEPRMRSFLKEGKFKDALYSCRAYVTQYTIWHKSHTEPVMRAGGPAEYFLNIDVRALASIVDDLMLCHIKADMMDEFPAVLERLRSNISHPDWQRKINYLHVLYALWPDWDREAGRREMKKLGSMANETDEEILQVYLDLYSDRLSFSQEQDLIDRILENTRSFTDRLHYKGAKAVLFLSIGDRQKAEAEFDEAVAEAREKKSLNEYQQYRFAQTLSLLGALRADGALLTEALDLYQKLLATGEWTPFGKATLLGLIGETYRRKCEWESARQTYEQALEVTPLPIDRVFLSVCLMQLDRLADAARTLGEVATSELSAAERVDYAFAFAALAIETGERKRLEEAVAHLKALQTSDPLFREQRDAFLVNVLEAQQKGRSLPLIARTRRLLGGVARFVSTYFVLKPSFMGMGVDVGKILEDFSKRGEKPNVRDN